MKFLSDIEAWPRAGSVACLNLIYECLNAEFFDGKLPRIPIRWRKCQARLMAKTRWRKHKGVYVPCAIWFDPALKGRRLQKQVGMSMLHEMAHIKLGVEVDCREWGGKFDEEMFRLAAAGAFRYFW